MAAELETERQGEPWRSESPITAAPYPYLARAWWGECLLAESEECCIVEEGDRPAVLYFPLPHVSTELLHQGRPFTCALKGTGSRWDVATAGAAPVSDVMWTVTDGGGAAAALAHRAAFDQSRVRIEVVDRRPGDIERDVTVKSFPTWGDAAHLVAMLDVRPDGGAAGYESVPRSDGRRPVVEGSQMLGQAIVAAMRRAPGRRVAASSMQFHRTADARQPLRFELDEVSAGRTFSGFTATVLQEGRRCATGTLLLGEPSADVVRHHAPMPEVAGPYDCPPFDMGVTGRDIRVVDGAYSGDPEAPVGPPVICAWVRYRVLPPDPALHAGLLAQFTGHMSIAAALRPHRGVGQQQAHRSISTAINAISLSIHADVRADRWLLYRHLSTFAGEGMTQAECRVHREDGQLVASFSVAAMVRPFAAGAPARDERTAL